MFFNKIKEYKKNKELSQKRKRSQQFISMFGSVTKVLSLTKKDRGQLMQMLHFLNFRGTEPTSTDIFIKIIILLHLKPSLGLVQLENISKNGIDLDDVGKNDLRVIYELLTVSFISVSEMMNNVPEEISSEPFNLYSNTRSYVNALSLKESNYNMNNMVANIPIRSNMIEHDDFIPEQPSDEELMR